MSAQVGQLDCPQPCVMREPVDADSPKGYGSLKLKERIQALCHRTYLLVYAVPRHGAVCSIY